MIIFLQLSIDKIVVCPCQPKGNLKLFRFLERFSDFFLAKVNFFWWLVVAGEVVNDSSAEITFVLNCAHPHTLVKAAVRRSLSTGSGNRSFVRALIEELILLPSRLRTPNDVVEPI